MSTVLIKNVERVPDGSITLVVPFLSAIAGLLESYQAKMQYRVVMHRTMVRLDEIYLQQISDYIASDPAAESGKGRILRTTTGIIGGAFLDGAVYRTKHYKEKAAFITDLKQDMKLTGNNTELSKVAESYLAVPIYGSQDAKLNRSPCLILYAEGEFNTFGNDKLVKDIIQMCRVFSRKIDEFALKEKSNIRNFEIELAGAKPASGKSDMYPNLHEKFGAKEDTLIEFENISTFNFDFVA